MRLPISVPLQLCVYLLSSAKYDYLLVENIAFFAVFIHNSLV